MHPAPPFVNIAAYKFISLDDRAELRVQLLALCIQLDLSGTILLAPEGINLFLAGLGEPMAQLLAWLRADARFSDLVIKESYSQDQPFKRMLVKLKHEIITMRMPLIQPENGRAPAVQARTLKRWLDQGHDDAGKPVVMLDTRNGFEVDVGSFDQAMDFRIAKFSDFPEAIASHKEELNDKTIVTFCTGGIRCEKAAIHMKNIGFESVLQLEGGILKYFEEVGGDHYSGDCFVFDWRTALNAKLEPAAMAQCTHCNALVTRRERFSSLYVAGKSCPQCAQSGSEVRAQVRAV